MIRAFLAIPLPEPVRSALLVQQFLMPLPRKEPAENLHLTLVFLGEPPDHILEAAHEAFVSLRSQPFDLRIEGFGLFGGTRPRAAYAVVTPCAPLMRLQAKAETAARRAGCEIPARRYIPHVTLGRFPSPAPDVVMRLERAIISAAGFRSEIFPVEEAVLYQSTLTPAGARYDALMRYPFR